MALPQLGYWDYLKAAFNLRVRLPLLGHMPLNWLALGGFSILGFGHPGFWLLGLGYEAAYLLWLTGSNRFQALVRGERLLEKQEDWEDHERRQMAELDRPSQDRYRQLIMRCENIMQARKANGFGAMEMDDLHQVRPAFLQLLGLRQRIQQLLISTRPADLEEDIKKIQQRMEASAPDSPVARALEGTLKIQQARLENLRRSMESLQYTNTELERVEKQLSLIAEEVTISRNPEAWAQSVDNVMETIQGTTKWMSDHSDLFVPEVMPTPTREAPLRPVQKQ